MGVNGVKRTDLGAAQSTDAFCEVFLYVRKRTPPRHLNFLDHLLTASGPLRMQRMPRPIPLREILLVYGWVDGRSHHVSEGIWYLPCLGCHNEHARAIAIGAEYKGAQGSIRIWRQSSTLNRGSL